MSDTELLNKASEAINAWGLILQATGGKLSHAKSVTYIYAWKWTKQDIQLRNIKEDQEAAHNIVHPTLADPETPQKYLGLHLAPNNGFDHEFELRLQQATNLRIKLAQSSLTVNEAKIAYNNVYLPSLKYIMPFTSFNENQQTMLQTAIIPHLLPKLGYNRHFPESSSMVQSGMGVLSSPTYLSFKVHNM